MKRINSVFDQLRSFTAVLILSVFLIGGAVVTAVVKKDLVPLLIGIAFLIGALVVLWIYSTLSTKKRGGERNAAVGGSALDFLMTLTLPAAVISGRGEIFWYNKAFASASGRKEALYHSPVSELVQDGRISLRRLREETPEELAENPVPAVLAGVKYEVVSYRISSDRMVTIWSSQEKLSLLQKELSDKNLVVAYAAVDSLSDSQSFLQGNTRTVTADIFVELKKWANSVNAVLREVGGDRYILLMEEQYLEELCEQKFDILDRVRELSAERVEIPLTVSIGVACIDGTMEEKEEAARQALELAMQRGGDQAVLKRRGNMVEYYGGRTKTVQKRTKIRSRVVASEVVNLAKRASNILIMGHRFPDHDSIGSCVGMRRFVSDYCGRVNIVVNTNDPNLRSVFQKLSALDEYRSVFVDGASAQDLITSQTLLIITDVNNVRQFEAPELFENIPTTVIVDHHRQSAEFAVKPKVTYIEPSASSATELVCEMLEQQLPPGSLQKEEAEVMFAGIILDTKQFTNNTGPRTFSAAHFLRSEGADPGEANRLFRTDLEDFKRVIKYEANAFIYRDIIAFSYIDDNATQEDKIAASKAADRLLTLDKVQASFVLCRMDDVVHISARSSGTVNVQLITERIGGGGHFDMAGAQVKGASIKDTFIRLKETIDQYLNEA